MRKHQEIVTCDSCGASLPPGQDPTITVHQTAGGVERALDLCATCSATITVDGVLKLLRGAHAG